MNIVLVGLRGSGKTSVGRILADRLGWPFLDTDAEVEREAGRSIRDIFEEDGENRFRDIEERVVRRVSERDGTVIATGGGVVLRSANVEALRKNGFVAHLDAPPETLVERIAGDSSTPSRRPPLLPGNDDATEMRRLAEARAPLYAAARDMVLDTSRLSPEEAAEAILKEMERRKLL
jgi:shikimate kinase